MKILKAMMIITGMAFAGEGLNLLLPLPIPGSIYGLLLMLIALCTGIVKLEDVKPTGNFLLDIITVFYIPITVKLVDSWVELKTMLVPAILAITVSTIIVMTVCGKLTQYFLDKKSGDTNE